MRRAAALAAPFLCWACGPRAPVPDAVVELPPFEVPVGEERTFCADVKVPLQQDAQIVKLVVDMAPGSHHFILFEGIGDRPDNFYDCAQGQGLMPAVPIFAAQHPHEEFNYPTGVGHRVRARQQMAMQLHAVNSSDATAVVRAKVSFYAGSPEEVRINDGIIGFSLGGIEIPPHASATYTRRCRIATGAKVFSMSSHAHGHLTEFTARSLSLEGAGEEVYRNTSWSDPLVKNFPDGEPLEVVPGGGLEFSCAYRNDTDAVVSSGPTAKDEMCIVFGHYTPGPGILFCLDEAEKIPACPQGPFDPATQCDLGDSLCKDVACPEFNTCMFKCGVSSGCFQCCQSAITNSCWSCVEPLAACAFKNGCINNSGLSFDCLTDRCQPLRRRCFGI